jgi:hypothetical protein
MPAVVTSFQAQIRPGGLERALDLTRRAAKPIERTGATSVRAFRGATGENYGNLLLAIEYPSMKAYGAGYDQIMKDDEIVSVLASVEAADSPYTAQQAIAVSTEIPIGIPAKRGPVLQAILSRPTPGRLEDSIELGSKAGNLLVKSGALSSRLFQTGFAGSLSGLLVLVTEYASMAALGEASEKLMESKETEALLKEVNGPKSPGTIISSDIYTELPL